MTGSEYEQSFRRRLEAYADGLSTDIRGLHVLSEELQRSVFEFLLELACRGQSSEAIRLGQRGIRALRRDWILERIRDTAHAALDLTDEYEYRRLLELAEALLDDDLLRGLVDWGRASQDEDVRETAEEFADVRPRPEQEPWSPAGEVGKALGLDSEPHGLVPVPDDREIW